MEIVRPKRHFIDENLVIDSWDKISKYFDDLVNREISSLIEFRQWLDDQSELEAVLEEDLAWRYIRMTINTRDEELTKKYTFFVSEIQPKIAPYDDQLNKKMVALPYLDELDKEEAFHIMFRKIKTSIKLYRKENIPLIASLSEESQKFGALSAAQNIEHDGEKLTMQKAALLLKETDEALRKEIYGKMADRRRQDFDKFDELFDSLREKRHQVAVNADFKNFRDYKLEAMGRFDYTVVDCKQFHASVKSEIVPLVKMLQEERLKKLGKDKFKPWDLDVDPEGRPPLKPFKTGEQLLEGSIEMFNNIDPFFGDCLNTMNGLKHLDLESKDGKAPGGYNYPLYEIGVPFIFMNAVGSQRDLVTMVHEGGHAVHSFLSRDLELTSFKSLPSEVAELASMSMELLTMSEWGTFYHDEEELTRAKKEQLESILKILPWIAQVDEFQHWLYENPAHTRQERTDKWLALSNEYGTGLVDWTGYEDMRQTAWQRQLHIFEVPFYYIEYGISQLGALGIWKNSIEDKSKAVNKYKEALKLAYTKSIPEIYETAGVKFDFSRDNIKELAGFVQEELKKL